MKVAAMEEVDHGIDADELLEQHDADRGDERRTGDAEQFAHTTLGVLRGHGFDFVELKLHLGLIDIFADKSEHLERLAFLAFAHQITGRFRQQQTADQQQRSRDERRAEHPPPIADTGDIVAEESKIGRVCQQNTERDHQLEQRGKRAATFLRRKFGEIRRSKRGGGANGEAENDSGCDHHQESGGQRAHAGTKQEQNRRKNQQFLATEPVGQRADGQRAHAGADEHGRGDEASLRHGQVEIGLDQRRGAGDDARIEAEKHASQRAEREDEGAVERESRGNAAFHRLFDGIDGPFGPADAIFQRFAGIPHRIGRL